MLVLHALLNPRSRGHYLQAVLKTTLFLLGHTKIRLSLASVLGLDC
jgi:hypothetical protein